MTEVESIEDKSTTGESGTIFTQTLIAEPNGKKNVDETNLKAVENACEIQATRQQLPSNLVLIWLTPYYSYMKSAGATRFGLPEVQDHRGRPLVQPHLVGPTQRKSLCHVIFRLIVITIVLGQTP